MNYDNIFNQYTLNVFVDASIFKHENKTYTGCPGCICVATDNKKNNQIIDTKVSIELNSTNNNSEIKAILHGVKKALEYRNNFKYINLFSDSMICIRGLREWIFKWINNMQNGKLYNSSGLEVANQEVISNIIYLITYNNLNINLFHQKGHVKMTNNSLENAINVFSKSNNINNLNIDFIKSISYYNNYIDQYTRDYLNNYINGSLSNYEYFYNPINRDIDKVDFDKYIKLVKGDK